MNFYRFSMEKSPEFGAFTGFGLDREYISWIQDHNWWQVEFVCHDGVYSVDGMTYPFRAGALLITPPESRCRIDRIDEGVNVNYWCCFRPVASRSLELSFPAVTDLSSEIVFWDTQLRFGLDRMPTTKAHLYSVMLSILWRVGVNGAEKQANHHVMLAEDFIKANIAEKLSLEEISAACGLNNAHLSRVFKSELGMTPIEYVRSLRVAMACRLLVGTNIPIKEVAIRVGMGDLQRFNKAIRETFKCSPRKLREQKASPDIYQSMAKDIDFDRIS